MNISNKEIAADLHERALGYPEWCDEGTRATFCFGTLKLTCNANKGAVEAMATKFGQRSKFKNPKPVRLQMPRREPSLQITKRYKWEDPELAQQFRNHFDIQLGIL